MTDPDPTDCAGGLTGGSARWTLTFGGGPAKRHQSGRRLHGGRFQSDAARARPAKDSPTSPFANQRKDGLVLDTRAGGGILHNCSDLNSFFVILASISVLMLVTAFFKQHSFMSGLTAAPLVSQGSV
jgi:hypothetical protein